VSIGGYTALVYSSTSGRVVGSAELPINAPPTWARQINASTANQITMPLQSQGWAPGVLRSLMIPWRFSIAVLWGDYVCNAGPITAYPVDDAGGTVQVSFGGFWSLLNRRNLHHPAYDPATTLITDPSADVTITGQLWDIAAAIVRNAVTMTGRPGSALPVDIPADSGTGTNTRTYNGFDLAPCGQRLQELTQVGGGPDVDFAPYLLNVPGSGRFIRHRMAIGKPYITQLGAPVAFDYKSTIQGLPLDADGSTVATAAWVKGAGNSQTQLSGYANNPGLITNGWPLLDYVDSNHSSESSQDVLNAYATADIGLYGKSTETWKPLIRIDGVSPLGSYDPGYFATYNVIGHPWIPDGLYSVRIIGLANGSDPNTVTHALDARGAF
jgi:hypothetical protein